jgi:hypothetical protein
LILMCIDSVNRIYYIHTNILVQDTWFTWSKVLCKSCKFVVMRIFAIIIFYSFLKVMQQWVGEFHAWWPPLRVTILHDSGSFQGSKASLIQVLIQCVIIIILQKILNNYLHLLWIIISTCFSPWTHNLINFNSF